MPLVCVYRASGPTDAYLVLHVLQANDIEAQVRGDLVGLRGEIPIGDSWPTVWVEKHRAEESEQLIRRFEGPRLVHPSWPCTECGEVNEPTFEWCWQCGAEPGATAEALPPT